MSRCIIDDVTHHVDLPDGPVACNPGIETGIDTLNGPFDRAVICTTRWELVTCMECQRKRLKTVTLRARVASFNFDDLPIAAWRSLLVPPNVGVDPGEEGQESKTSINVHPAEPERGQRTEGDDLLDFFKGKS